MPRSDWNFMKECKFAIPSLKEQEKIANFLLQIDNKVDFLNKQLDKTIDFKKYLMQNIFSQKLRFDGFDDEWEHRKLGELCEITTGKLNANAMVEGGKYRFYTCAEDYYYIDNYAFDTDALLISGNGANVGYIHHYNGKFNAYQRTYVLDGFKDNIKYIKFVLEQNLHKRIEREKK